MRPSALSVALAISLRATVAESLTGPVRRTSCARAAATGGAEGCPLKSFLAVVPPIELEQPAKAKAANTTRSPR